MPKNIVILFDGTSNEISADRTNILRLYGTLKKSEDQVVWYDPGVGTIGLAWLGIWRKFIEIFGLATGFGLDKNVKEAYRFLVESYQRDENGARDRIFIFGFSRGAYSARVLAGFIHAFGLMEKRNLNLLDYVYRAYKRIGEGGNEDAFSEMRLFERTLRADRPPIRMLGLFDTVASVIETGRFGLRLKSNAHTSTNSSVQSVRHAVAIDERRTMFEPMLWPETQDYSANRFDTSKSEPQDAKEVWFRGVHGDVGGGYPEASSALAKVPLAWMISEAKETELQFVTRTVNDLVLGRAEKYVPPNAHAKHHDSMTFGWSFVELLPRKLRSHSKRPRLLGLSIPLKEWRWIPPGAKIHRSVEQAGYHPPNVPDTFDFVD